MGSPLGRTLADAFLVYFEKNWLQNCLSDFKPHFYRRHIDYTFFVPPEHLGTFQNFQNGRGSNIIIYN